MENRLNILIVVAMQEELDSIIAHLHSKFNTINRGNFTFYEGTYLTHKVWFILSGIGKVNATIHTQFMIDTCMPDLVINVGVAGALNSQLNFGDVVIADSLVQHDMDVSAFGIRIGQVPRINVFAFPSDYMLLQRINFSSLVNYPVHIGRIISGDQFIDDHENAINLAKQFDALACEMEGAAIGHTCYVNKTAVLVIRAVSDMAGAYGKGIHSFNELKEMAADRASSIVMVILKNI